MGSIVEGEVKNKTEFGLFIGLDGDVDGMVHLSDLDWNRPGEQVIEEYQRGEMVKAKVLDVDVEKERISLGIKQLATDAVGEAATSGELRKNAVVTCEVIGINDGGIEVRLVESRHRDLHPARRSVARPRRAASGALHRRPEGRRPRHLLRQEDAQDQLSIKALEIAEEKEAVAQYGSTDSGASLGDILGAALKNREK